MGDQAAGPEAQFEISESLGDADSDWLNMVELQSRYTRYLP